MPKSKVRKKNDFTVSPVSRISGEDQNRPVEHVVRGSLHRSDADRPGLQLLVFQPGPRRRTP